MSFNEYTINPSVIPRKTRLKTYLLSRIRLATRLDAQRTITSLLNLAYKIV